MKLERNGDASITFFPPADCRLMIVDTPLSRLVHFVVLAGTCLILIPSAVAQQSPIVRHLVYIEDGREIDRHTVDSPTDASLPAQDRLDEWRRSGFLSARIDSIVSAADSPNRAVVHLHRGPLFTVSAVRIKGTDSAEEAYFHYAMLDSGDPFEIERVEEELDRVATRLAAAGHPMVRVALVEVEIVDGDAVELAVNVDLGPTPFVRGIEVTSGARTVPAYLMRLTGLQVGMTLTSFDPHTIRQRILASGHFRHVGLPTLVYGADSVTVRILIEEEPPGNFDLVFGYSPGGVGGGVVGSGRIDLQNPFGAGRSILIALDRLPGQVSRIEAMLADPYVLGTPLSAAVAFEGFQQDSLFNRQRYSFELGYRLDLGLELFGTVSRRQTQPGTAGTRVDGGRQRVAEADVLGFGVGFRSSRLDFPRSPTRGHSLDAIVESGTSRRSLSRVVAADTMREHRSVRVDGFTAAARLYRPVGRRGVFVTGGDVHAMRGDEFDRSDLRHIGGHGTLRGYDQDQFLVRASARGVLEFRYRLDPISFVNLFVDAAYLERPSTPSLEDFSMWRTGYGFGGQFDTGFSLMNVAVAFNPQDGFSSPRIHAGMAFGL